MKEIALPEQTQQRTRRASRLSRENAALGILSFVFALLAVLSMVGTLVCVILYEFKRYAVLPILIGGLGGGALFFGGLGFLFARWQSLFRKRMDDYLERLDGAESFFVGEGTLATFGPASLLLHSEKRKVEIPYAEMRAFSVCTRKAPREKGEWNIVFELPSSYLSGEKGTSLVQLDDKPRLRSALAAHGIALGGEDPHKTGQKKYTKEKTFSLPDRARRKRALFGLAFSAVLLVAAVLLGVFWDAAVGGVVGVFGIFVAGRGGYAFAQARALFRIYDGGVYWKGSQTERVFLKWEEIEKVTPEERNGHRLLLLQCEYGAYRFPRVEGVYEEIAARHPEKT